MGISLSDLVYINKFVLKYFYQSCEFDSAMFLFKILL